jgi:hypothetical protein
LEEVAPCHCSGDVTCRLFHEAYGDSFYPAGVGWSLELGPKSIKEFLGWLILGIQTKGNLRAPSGTSPIILKNKKRT